MKLTRIAAVALLGIALISTVACGSSSHQEPTPTPTHTVVPSPTPTHTITPTPTPTLVSTPASTCFSFVGNPSGWSVLAGYTDPPTITYDPSNGKYVISNCSFSFGGNDYRIGISYDGGIYSYSYAWSESEVTSIDCALYNASTSNGSGYAGVWYLDGQKSAFERLMKDQGFTLTCDANASGMFKSCSAP